MSASSWLSCSGVNAGVRAAQDRDGGLDRRQRGAQVVPDGAEQGDPRPLGLLQPGRSGDELLGLAGPLGHRRELGEGGAVQGEGRRRRRDQERALVAGGHAEQRAAAAGGYRLGEQRTLVGVLERCPCQPEGAPDVRQDGGGVGLLERDPGEVRHRVALQLGAGGLDPAPARRRRRGPR